ncbi:hypothetical protein AVEN_257849-1 [Araneus ventricosus]|uniref:Uncharacterized protein n=1 Tax=Araneus ventricosus TaxID=182803 RepID=A0A4Y2EI26_ARAVE|nr:hypothetical protein AVEN_257849-1 [Araneus ventricosus]
MRLAQKGFSPRLVTRRYGALNLLQREIPKASVKMATVQQKARLWFHESKSIVTAQRRFRFECRNCQSSSKNSIKRWYEQFKGTGKVLDGHRSQTKLLNE